MRRLLLLGLATLSLVGCDQVEFNGSFRVFKDLVIEQKLSDSLIDFCRRHPDDRWCERHEDELNQTGVELQAGETVYGSVETTANDAIKLHFGEKGTIRIKLPEDFKLPRHGGSFSLAPEQIEQDFAASGDVEVSESRSGPHRGTESCTVSRERRVCHDVPVGDGHYRRECHWETVYESGTQEIEYEIITTEYDLTFDLIEPLTTEVIVGFSGRDTQTDRNVLYRGRCYVGGFGRPDRGW